MAHGLSQPHAFFLFARHAGERSIQTFMLYLSQQRNPPVSDDGGGGTTAEAEAEERDEPEGNIHMVDPKITS